MDSVATHMTPTSFIIGNRLEDCKLIDNRYLEVGRYVHVS